MKTYTCTVCNETKTEEISATGHQHTEIENKKDATCSEAGYTGDAICPTCGQVVEEGQIVAALGHEYQDGRCVRCDAVETAVSQTPETGDQEQARLWLLALIAAAGIGGAASGQKKRSENR